MSAKKIKLLFAEPCPRYFGGYFRALNICQSLSQLNYDIDLFFCSQKKFSFSVEKIIVNSRLKYYLLPRLYFHLFFQGRLLRAFITILFGLYKNYDIYHFGVPVDPETSFPALFFKFIGKKVVIDWDDIYEFSALRSRSFVLRYIKLMEYNFPRIFNNYSVTTDYLKEIAINRGATNTIKIINGVNQRQFILPITNSTNKKIKHLLSIGNTFDGPRGSLLLDTFTCLLKLDSNYRLITNVDPQKIDQKLSPEISSKIISVGFIKPESLGKYMAQSLGALFLSDSSPVEKAGFPMRIGSFLNGELPIFAIQNDTEVSKLINQYGCGVQAKDPQELAQTIHRSLQDQKIYQQLKTKTIRAKKLLSTDHLAKQLDQYYQQLLKA